MFGSQERRTNFGLLIMRVGLATTLLIHSLPKLLGAAPAWRSLGTMLGFINVGVAPAVLGFAILLIEALGGISLLCGYYFRIACLALFIPFGLYFFNYFSIGYNSLMLWSIGIATVLLGLLLMGPGRYALASKRIKR